MASHSWDAAGQGKMKIVDQDVGGMYGGLPMIVDPQESERLVEGLRKFDIEEVGSSEYLKQHEVLEKLNVQAHQSVMTNSDEYVLEAMLTFEKLDVLIHDLIVIEAWKEKIYPLLLDRVAGRNTMRVYFILYHEATVVNFLEVFLYHKHVCEALGDRAIELVDFCARKLVRLNGGYDFRAIEPADRGGESNVKDMADELAKRTPKEELSQHLTEIEFRVCIASVSVARMLCEHADAMPLSIVSRITDTHDLLMLFIPLIENPPWTRRLPDTGKWQKLVEQKWTDVQPIDLLKITKLEGQPWIGLYQLIAKEVFRERYALNSFRKGQLLRVRKFINDVVLDQLPFLADIQRYMDELQVMDVPEAAAGGQGSVFLLQQVAVTRDKLVSDRDWPAAADRVMKTVFTMTDRDDKDLRRMADFYADDNVGDILEPEAAAKRVSKEEEDKLLEELLMKPA
jgi:zinc finger MYND domain-containing protein 10